MSIGVRWTVRDRDGNEIYLTQERWDHITDPTNHPEMAGFEDELQQTIQRSRRKQDPLNPQKYVGLQDLMWLTFCMIPSGRLGRDCDFATHPAMKVTARPVTIYQPHEIR